MSNEFELTPTQRQAAEWLKAECATTSVILLRCGLGKGRTTILRSVHASAGGSLIGAKDFVRALLVGNPTAIEEAVWGVIEARLDGGDLLFIDDFHLIRNVVSRFYYLRHGMLDTVLTAVLDRADIGRKRIVFGIDDDWSLPAIGARARTWKLGDFSAADYEAICRRHLPEAIAGLDYPRIHRFAPMLNLWQLRNACLSLAENTSLDTDKFVDYLSAHDLVSNVSIEEVRPVDLKDIKGVDDVIEALEAKIALPFENPVLAAEFDLKPRRGVLLSGPPGTGKTTIGRALARRLKSKFFLIDGTAISGTEGFYETLGRVFEAAAKNAPSIIFIDDADVMFEHGGDRGLYRFLLTKLDGLQSASAERICVMLTAMDPASLPPALVRSGRLELWLETRLPDLTARATIFRERLAKLPEPIASVDCNALAGASHGLTGADLCSAVEDGKLLLAHDKANGKPLRPAEEYFIEAIESVRENRRNYAKRRPSLFDAKKIGFDLPTSA
jgi:SpoVK/Ycf46/Vps4 family AAA+-type ATPase